MNDNLFYLYSTAMTHIYVMQNAPQKKNNKKLTVASKLLVKISNSTAKITLSVKTKFHAHVCMVTKMNFRSEFDHI